jgi:hypothetical protein
VNLVIPLSRTCGAGRASFLKLEEQLRQGTVPDGRPETVAQCIAKWLERGAGKGGSWNPSTKAGYVGDAAPMIEILGRIKLIDLQFDDVDVALAKIAQDEGTRSVALAKRALAAALTYLQQRNKVTRNGPSLRSPRRARRAPAASRTR